jgi:NAD(P)H dehydrogenase (quinone)
MIIIGLPFIVPEPINMKEITNISPYRAYTTAGSDCSRQPTENELTIDRSQGKRVAEIAQKL